MRKHYRCIFLKKLSGLSVKLVEKNRVLYDFIYLLIKLVLILTVSFESVKRVPGKSPVKNKLRNSTGDDLLSHCLATFNGGALFLEV